MRGCHQVPPRRCRFLRRSLAQQRWQSHHPDPSWGVLSPAPHPSLLACLPSGIFGPWSPAWPRHHISGRGQQPQRLCAGWEEGTVHLPYTSKGTFLKPDCPSVSRLGRTRAGPRSLLARHSVLPGQQWEQPSHTVSGCRQREVGKGQPHPDPTQRSSRWASEGFTHQRPCWLGRFPASWVGRWRSTVPLGSSEGLLQWWLACPRHRQLTLRHCLNRPSEEPEAYLVQHPHSH